VALSEHGSTLTQRVDELLAARGQASTWLHAAIERLESADVLTAARVAIAQAPRKLGRELADVGRAALLRAAVERVAAAQQVEFVGELVRHGELGEQASLLRAFSLLPEPSRFVDLAIDSCRTNAVDVFSAIALDNPYPADWFPEHNFNQMVLKALFIGVPVERIVGLERRANPELARMVAAYASERRAAGRSVPAGVEFVAERCPKDS
jgi:hypothetical protein